MFLLKLSGIQRLLLQRIVHSTAFKRIIISNSKGKNLHQNCNKTIIFEVDSSNPILDKSDKNKQKIILGIIHYKNFFLNSGDNQLLSC